MEKEDNNDFVRISHLRSLIPIKSFRAIKKLITKDKNFPKPYEIGKSKFYKRSEVVIYLKNKKIENN